MEIIVIYLAVSYFVWSVTSGLDTLKALEQSIIFSDRRKYFLSFISDSTKWYFVVTFFALLIFLAKLINRLW